MNWQTVFNPLSKFSETKIFLFGIISTILGSYIGYYFGASFDGVFDVHSIEKKSFATSILENCVNIILVTVLLYCLGLFINKRTRIIDILNTALLYRIPLYITAATLKLPFCLRIQEQIIQHKDDFNKITINPLDLIYFSFYTILLLLLVVYAVVLLTKSFNLAVNVKKTEHFVAFAIILLIAEVISKIIWLKLF